MKKRILSFVLVLVLAFCLCACSSESSGVQSSGRKFPYRPGALNLSAHVNQDYAMVYESPYGKSLTALYKDDLVYIYTIQEDWAETNEGWIRLEMLNYDAAAIPEVTIPDVTVPDVSVETQPQVTTPPVDNSQTALFNYSLRGEVTGDTLRIRMTPGDGEVVGHLDTGDQVIITQITHVNQTLWCYIGSGWISMDFVLLPDFNIHRGFVALFKNETQYYPQPGGSASSGSVSANSTVSIFELYTMGTAIWGRSNRGWVDMSQATLPYGVHLSTGYFTPEY